MEIKLFGIATDIVGRPALTIDSSLYSARDLRNYLLEKYPEFQTINGFMIAINQEYAEDTDKLTATDEVAIIPPVSGG